MRYFLLIKLCLMFSAIAMAQRPVDEDEYILDGQVADRHRLNEVVDSIKSMQLIVNKGPYICGFARAMIVQTRPELPKPRSLQIVNEEGGQPLPFASVTVYDEVDRKQDVLIADSMGVVIINNNSLSEFKLSVTSVGFREQVIQFRDLDTIREIKMEPIEHEAVVVQAFGIIRCSSLMVCHDMRIPDTIITLLATPSDLQTEDLKSSPHLPKCFPNPVVAGQRITIESPSTDAIAAASIQLFSLNGNCLFTQNQVMIKGQNIFTVPTSASWAKGTYLVRLSAGGKRLLSQKIIIN